MFLNPMYSDEELCSLYPADYYAYQRHCERPAWKEIAKKLVGFQTGTKEPSFPRPGKMLDLGCGTGWFLQEKRKAGWEVQGVEISTQAASVGKEHGLPIFAGTIAEAQLPDSTFDYVRANHSFEHICRPHATLEHVYRVLKPGGKVLIGVPNLDGLNARLFREYWWYLGAPVHPYSYSVRTLAAMLKKHRFEIEKVNFNSDYSGLLGSVQIWMNRRNGRKSTDGALMNSTPLKVFCHWVAKCVDLFHAGDAIEIIARKPSQ